MNYQIETLNNKYDPIAQVKISQNIQITNYLDRRIATAIEDLPGLDALDRRHFCSKLKNLRKIKRELSFLRLKFLLRSQVRAGRWVPLLSGKERPLDLKGHGLYTL
jgi:hypothetical protein